MILTTALSSFYSPTCAKVDSSMLRCPMCLKSIIYNFAFQITVSITIAALLMPATSRFLAGN